MGGENFGGTGEEGLEGLKEVTKEEPLKALVVEDVRVYQRKFVVDVPKYQNVNQIKYITTEEKQTKYNTEEQSTTKYIPQDKVTIKYTPKEEDTIKYKVVEKECEKPIINAKEYIIATYKDVDAIKALLELVPKVLVEIEGMKEAISKIKDYKLIETELKVPKVKWIPTEEERVVWKDVPKERCENCSKEVE